MKRKLTIHFNRAITDSRLEKLEVVVTPLASANRPDSDQTILGLKQTREVILREPVTTVVFELTPTYQTGLDNPIMYRIAWRRGSFGRIESYEFSMPNQSVDFDDLFDLGNIVSGEDYLLREDMGEPGGVARLNEEGQVLDANGNIILSGDTTQLRVQLSNEIMQREAGDAKVRNDLTSRIIRDIEASEGRREAALGTAVSNLQALVSNEATTRANEDERIISSIDGVRGSVNTTANTLRNEFADADQKLDLRKADLVGGKIPASQLPDIALGTAVVVENQSEMLALTSTQVQPGDLAVRPDGTFMLVVSEPWNIDSWRRITSKASVVSVNGQTGAVTLSYDDVEARSIHHKIPESEILGLDDTLSGKADVSVTNHLGSRINSESSKLTTLTGRVDGMVGAWSTAVAEAKGYARAALESSEDAASTVEGIQAVEGIVSGIKTDVVNVQGQVNETADAVDLDAAEVRHNLDLISDMVAVQVTALGLLNERFGNMDSLVTSVNNVRPGEDGNVSIFGGGTDLSLTEDANEPGLYHVSAETKQE